MQFNESQPIYLQVVLQIKKEIVTGKKKNGEKLKSGRDAADFIARFKKDMSELGYTEDEMRALI